jgi:hypothetical protein
MLTLVVASCSYCVLLAWGVLVFASGIAFAEPDEQPENTSSLPSAVSAPTAAPKTDKPPVPKTTVSRKDDIKNRVAEWLKTCLGDWDRATHMTKQEWRATCERVAAERGKFLLDNPTVGRMLLGVSKDYPR